MTEKQIDETARIIQERKGLELTPERVIENGGRWLQLLHLGPYEKLGETYSVPMKEAEKKTSNRCPDGTGKRTFQTRVVAPEKLKTIVRLCVEAKILSDNQKILIFKTPSILITRIGTPLDSISGYTPVFRI